ncbi:unnamed protein product [Camellia sinensis]
MDRHDASHPISVILNGSNYVLWAQAMSSFLKGKKLWRIVTGDVAKPVKDSATTETPVHTATYEDRLEEWDSKNYQIITWFRNTSITSISLQFGRFQLDSVTTPAKDIWDFLKERYQTTGLAHQYQLQNQLHRMRQESTQSINDFLSQIYSVWDQLALSEPAWHDPEDAVLFTIHRNQQRLVQFLMALTSSFEPVRASLLHRHPLPTLEQAISELLSEETRLGTLQTHHVDSVLATPPSRPSFPQRTTACLYCQNRGLPSTHLLVHCPVRSCRYCNKLGPGHLQQDCFRNPSRSSSNSHSSRGGSSRGNFHRSGNQSHHTAAAASGNQSHHTDTATSAGFSESPTPSTPRFSPTDVEAMLKQLLSPSGTPPPTALSVIPGNSSWYFDSACCNHMTSSSTIFSSLSSSPHIPSIHTADGSLMSVRHVGTVSTSSLSIPHVYHIPALTLNLISIGQLCELGLTVTFSATDCLVQDPQTGQTIGIGRKHGRLYELIHLHVPASPQIAAPTSTSSLSPFHLWHCRLGHISVNRLRSLVSSGQLGHVIPDNFDCIPCQLAKQPALSFNKSTSVSLAPFDLIHSDIWGPSPTTTMGGSRYFVVFIDDFSRFTWLFLMKHRSELKHIYYRFAQMVHTQFSKTIKIFRSDNAMEYRDSDFLSFLQHHGTLPHRSCAGTSQQNGRAERKHRHILDTTRALLLSSSCPENFWGEAALTAVYTINCSPTPVIHNQTPFERLHGTPPPYANLRVFGSACFVLLQSHEHTKLEPRSRLCCFLGYSIEHKGFRCWDPLSKRLRISRHVVFWEHQMFSSLSSFHLPGLSTTALFTDPSIDLFSADFDTGSSSIETPLLTPDPVQPALPEGLPLATTPPSPPALPPTDPPPGRPRRVTQPPIHLRDYIVGSAAFSTYEPTSYREACTNPLWQQAMTDELHALDKAHTWDLVDLPPGKTAIGCKWVYKIKTHSDGSIERYKARLVAKGFNQEYGIDYEETFSPVTRLTSVRSLLAVATARHWGLFQMDVKNAFLNGHLLEEVYMQPPPGSTFQPHQVCKLQRALYGLKQAPRAWFATFSSTILDFGFTSSSYDSALFIRTTAHGTTLLLLYVDDMIITGNDTAGILHLKQFLHQQFEMKDLGTLNYFLGLEVSHDSTGSYLSQAKYASDLLARAGLTDCKTASTPIDPQIRLTPLDGTLLSDATLYRQLVGSLVYLTVTRPDIAYAVHIVSQYMSAPRTPHYTALLRILRYLKGTLFHGLHFSASSSLDLRAFSDADWAGDPTDRRSTTGFCFFLGDSLLAWRSKKQSLTARSSTEAEYRALADTTQELLWLRWLLADMGVSSSTPTPLYCDNRSAIQIAHNDVFHDRTKHIEIDCHFIRQHVTCGTVHLLPIASVDQPADIFTKAHPPGRFTDLVSKLNLVDAFPP